ncbi:glycoside hydrolase family 16 protein [Schizophyllum amplum]|uniref:Glycoside hydrolase family 16 protein n=1 Tax=Schizophyllum amplum TaxID=97359 RepID=A0A550BWL6_9AGAR|nr:glycoside hydrolase family 16 protein [Auriculariopsis ampla]
MSARIFTAAASLLPLLAPTAASSYDLVKEYSGDSFFDGWSFYGNFDNLTNGDATFLSSDENKDAQLAYVDSSTSHAIIKVDNTTNVPFNEKRNTIRIASEDRYDIGSVFVADMYHVPYGCSVWPAWWSQAPDWPTGGEIDTFEGVNMVTMNQMALHTEEGCTQNSPSQSSTLVNSTDCNYQANENEGCVVTDPETQSYGEAFAKAGGGVWVTEFAETGISIWFYQRSDVPDAISSNSSSIDTSSLGTPVANWPTGGCDIDTYFEAQSLIFDITLCGDFAGADNVFAETCTGYCYEDYVVGDGSAYNNAYFDIASVRVYGASGTNVVVGGDSAAAPNAEWGLGSLLTAAGLLLGVAL